MKLHLVLTFVALLFVPSVCLAKDDITKELITSNGKTRAYYLYVPSTVQSSSPAPLIVMLQVGDSDQYFPLEAVRLTRDKLNSAGFSVELIELPNHDHRYYDIAPKITRTAWDFLKKYELPADPKYRKYNYQ